MIVPVEARRGHWVPLEQELQALVSLPDEGTENLTVLICREVCDVNGYLFQNP